MCKGFQPLLFLFLLAPLAQAAPSAAPYPVEGPDDTVAISASALSGWYATADSFEDSVEVRDINRTLLDTITPEDLLALCPWMNLSGGPDAISGLAWSDSGRSLFILVHDAALPGDGLGSDAVLRYEAYSGALTTFARLELFDSDAAWPHLAALHARGRLYVGTASQGLKIYSAGASASTGTLLSTTALPDGGSVRAIALDRDNNTYCVASDSNIYRATLGASPAVFTLVGALPNTRALAASEQYGGPSNPGLYALTRNATTSTINFIPFPQARGTATFAPTIYTTSTTEWHDLAATADGHLLIAADEDAVELSDTTDTRLPFNTFIASEFNSVVSFARGLISPDGEPPGWVLDADVQLGWSRFHPATPDGACWTILALLAADHIYSDPLAQSQVRTILLRYSGLAADGIAPALSPDGFIEHWINPLTGATDSGWPAEFATYSTMKLCVAAERAMAYYPDDAVIQQAGQRIMCRVKNHDNYIQNAPDAVYLISRAVGGPDTGARNFPFVEAIIFVEQAATYASPYSVAKYARWLNRVFWPTAQYIPGKTVSGSSSGSFHPAFITGYSLLLQRAFRDSPAWQTHTSNCLESHAAWTDDNAPRFFTVFSAGTTRSDWGGYHADSISSHDGNITTFPSLLAFCATGKTHPAVAAYHAYRRGARQTFLTGASILYRRSDIDRAYQPDSAGLPDVVLGALGLAELLSPGFVDQVLAHPYDPYACPPDVNNDARTTIEDLYRWHAAPIDLNRDAVINNADAVYLRTYLRRSESRDTDSRN